MMVGKKGKAMIFLVSSGSYSDYSIVAAFSTREKAERYAAEYGDASVEEYEIDGFDEHIRRARWEAAIDLSDGALLDECKYDMLAPPTKRTDEIQGPVDFRNMRSGSNPLYGRLFCKTYSYVSAEHARKLAAEARQSYLRNGTLVGGSDES